MPKHYKTKERKVSLGQYWLGELESAGKHFEKWMDRGQQVVRRYRDERDIVESKRRRFNILWSNVQVMKPALYGRMPKPEVTRRFKDQDPVGRAAANMLERCLEYEVEQYPDFDATMQNVVEDRLLPGRGTAWIRYEPNIVSDPQVSEDVDSTTEHLAYECAPTDYVHWQDFCHTPARVWEEVWWVARRVWMTEEEGIKRFGEIFNDAPLSSESQKKLKDTDTPKEPVEKKAEVWEVWDKHEKQVCWIAKGLDKELDVKPDPLELEDFFPCPRPLYSTVTTGSLVPVPDYLEYQDQAEELDALTARISKLTKALKVVGVYNAEYPAIKRLLQEGFDNELIPVDSWAAFAEKKGLEGAIQLMQIKEVIETLVRMYEAREQVKQIIYEVMGISDILRGATEAQETLGAQQLKAQFGSMRMKSSQGDVARFATWLLRAKAHIICKLFSPKTIVQMSGIQYTADAQLMQPALQLLKSPRQLKDFRIEVAADSMVQIDEARDKAERLELVSSVGTYLKEALPIMQMVPQAASLLGEILMFGLRAFKVGKGIEAAFEKTLSGMGAMQPQGVPQEQVKQLVDQARQEEKQQATRELGHIKKESELGVRELKVNTAEQLLGLQETQVRGELEGIAKDETSLIERQRVGMDRDKFAAERSDKQGTVDSNTAMVKVGEAAEQVQETLREMLALQAAPKTAKRNEAGEIVITPMMQ